jgi:uncharacterized repeat protein (TIGR01451 family)
MAALAAPAQAFGASADLSVSLSESPDPVAPGANLTYKATALNNGPDNASSAALSFPIPAGTTFMSFSAPVGWTLSAPVVGGTGTASATNVTMGAFTGDIFTLVVHATTAGPFTATATITSATSDPNPSNNAATLVTNQPVSVPAPTAPAPTVTSTPTKRKKCKKKKPRRSAVSAKKRCKKNR